MYVVMGEEWNAMNSSMHMKELSFNESEYGIHVNTASVLMLIGNTLINKPDYIAI